MSRRGGYVLIVVEGISASGKTTWCCKYAAGFTVPETGPRDDALDASHPRRRDHDLSSLRFAGGYANMMPDIVAQLTEACRIDFDDAFGQTEASLLVAHGLSRPGETPSLRKQPTPLLDVRIVDDAMNDMPVGKPGECIVRGRVS